MKRKKLSLFSTILLVCFFCFSMSGSAFAQTVWDVPINVEGGNNEQFNLIFGAKDNATDGFDQNIDEAAPPVVPGGSDAHLFIPIFPNRLSEDYRWSEDPDNEHDWTLRFIDATGFGNNTLSWQSATVPNGSVLTISSNQIGEVNMLMETSVQFTGTEQFIIHFEGPITPPHPDIAVVPTSHDYGEVKIGLSASKTFVVTNEGTADLEVSAVTLDGTDPDQYSIDSGGGSFTLAPSATRNVVVSFNPTSESTKDAILRFASNDPDENPFDVTLTGKGKLPLKIIAETLPDGKVNVAYSATVETVGGVGNLAWEISAGSLPPGLALNASTGEISGTPAQDGDFTFTVKVTDEDDPPQTDSKEFTVNIRPELKITTETLPDGKINVAYSATLETVGGVGNLAWEISAGSLPPGLALNASTGEISGTPAQDGDFTFTVKVTDEDDPPQTDSKEYTVNIRPELKITTDTLPGGKINVAYSATLETVGGVGNLAWEISAGSLPPGLALNASTGEISGTPAQDGDFTFTVKVTDEDDPPQTDSKEFTVNIRPELKITTDTLPGGKINVAYSANLETVGGVGNLAWEISAGSLPPGLSLNASTGEISGTPAQDGDFTFTVKVMDEDDPPQTDSKEFTIEIRPELKIITDTLPGGKINVAYSATLETVGGVGNLAWEISAGSLPPGLSLNASTGEISGTPAQDGDFTFTVKVTDEDDPPQTDSKEFTIEIRPELKIITDTLSDGNVNVAYSETVQAVGGVGNLSWEISVGSLPPGLSLNASTGEISGTPTQDGDFTFTVKVTDEDDPPQTDSKEFTITIAKGLFISTVSLPDGKVNVAYSATVESENGVGNLAWEISAGSLPPGLSLNASTGEISGTPTQDGDFTFTVKVTDEDDPPQTDSKEFTVNIRPELKITTDTLPDGKINVAYSATLETVGGVGNLAWEISAGSLPPGLALNASTGEISGTPAAQDGDFTFTVKVTDEDDPPQTDSKEFTVNIRPELKITTDTLPDGKVNVAYSATVESENGVGNLSWEISAGSLPPGLALNASTGEISGTPAQDGDFTFTVKVTDEDDPPQTDSKEFTVNIRPELKITTDTLPGGKINVAYSATVETVGGVGNLAWEISAGSLPPGLALNASTGEISGTPAQDGDFTFTVKVTDEDDPPQTDSKEFTVNIRPELKITTDTLPDGKVNVAYSATVESENGVGNLSWEISAGSLPPGLALNASTGEISGTPAQDGDFTFTVKVTDEDDPPQTDSKEFTVNIRPALKITTETLPGGKINVAYSATVESENGVGNLSWEISAGSLPPGLALNVSTGEITGTPTLDGDFTFTVKVTDEDDPPQTDSKEFTVNIRPELMITTETLPEGNVGVPYSATVKAAGGAGNLAWEISAGSLPPGLALSVSKGEISGTPTQEGDFTFTVKVTDEDDPPQTDSKEFTIKINLVFCDLSVDPTSWDFGNVFGFEDKTFVLSNSDAALANCTGSASITGDAEFSIVSGENFDIPPGGTHELVVRFTCEGQTGVKNATLVLSSNDPDGDIDVPLTGECISEPDIVVDPETLDFGDVPVDEGKDPKITVSNEGTADLIVTDTDIIGADADQFELLTGGAPFTLKAGESQQISLDFSPTSVGQKTATLRIRSNDPDEDPFDATLLGNGTGGPELSLGIRKLDYGDVIVGTELDLKFTVRNKGNAPLEVTRTAVRGTNKREWKITDGGAPFTVAPGEGHEVTVNFSPTSVGEKTAYLNIDNNDSDESRRSINLLGNGIEATFPVLAVDSTSLNFSDVIIDSTLSDTIMVRNTGTADLDITAMAITGADSAEFAVDTTAVPFTIAPQDSHEVILSFSPASEGEKSATLSLFSNDPGNQGGFDIPLLGNGISDPPVAGFSSDVTYGLAPLAIQFTDLSTGTIDSYLWDFGDGNTSTEQNPAHTYNLAPDQTSTVSLTVSGPSGSNSVAKEGYIIMALPPQQVASLPDTFAVEDGGTLEVLSDLNTVFQDNNDSHELTFSASSNSEGVIPVVEEANLSLAFSENFFGNAEVYVTASNGFLAAHDTFAVQVAAINDAPGTFARLLPEDDSVVSSAPVTFTWSRAVDVDGDEVSYTLLVDITGVANTFVITDTSLAVDLMAYGATGQNETIYWSVQATDGSLQTQASNADGKFQFDATVTTVGDPDVLLPTEFGLTQNYPNPFNPGTAIRFSLPTQASVKLHIYSINGILVRQLINNNMAAGLHTIKWDGLDDVGQKVSSGVYVYRFEAGSYVATKRMILMK